MKFNKTITILFFTFYFLLSTPVPAQAQGNECCVSTNTSGSKTCRVATQDKPCDTAIRPAVPRVVCRVQQEFCIPSEGSPAQPGPEAPTACNIEQICIQARNLEADCEGLPVQLACQGSRANCFWFVDECYNQNDHQICGKITNQSFCGPDKDGKVQGSKVCAWANGHCVSRVEQEISAQYKRTGGFLPDCAYAGNCRSVSDFLSVFISIAREAFKYIGSIAFLMFVYGGITIVLSFGSPDKVQKGKQILVAAVIGIAISFSAFILVDFLLKTLLATQFSAL